MKEYTKVCWYCHEETMVPDKKLGHSWLKCSSCGATEFPNPTTLGSEQLFKEKEGPSRYDTKYRPRRRKIPKAQARGA